jgi:hypothetical protein
MKKLPKDIHVTWRELDNDDPYLAAYTVASECLEDDGPTTIGTYRLVSTKTVEKVIREVTR